jgi:hypothetical protein
VSRPVLNRNEEEDFRPQSDTDHSVKWALFTKHDFLHYVGDFFDKHLPNGGGAGNLSME